MPAKHPATDSTSTPESRSARLKRLADENLADELTIEPARKSIKAREAEMLALLQTKEPENAKAAEHENRHLGTESVDEFQDNREQTDLIILDPILLTTCRTTGGLLQIAADIQECASIR